MSIRPLPTAGTPAAPQARLRKIAIEEGRRPLRGLALSVDRSRAHGRNHREQGLLDDSLRLATEDRTEVHIWEDMPHVFPNQLGLFDASGLALDAMATFLKKELA